MLALVMLVVEQLAFVGNESSMASQQNYFSFMEPVAVNECPVTDIPAASADGDRPGVQSSDALDRIEPHGK
ncbi:MAG: hypothetical protein AAGJ83_01655, partial [Planctomycetota bacterium]